jgi:aldehyde dehydrogenase (NAD+)
LTYDQLDEAINLNSAVPHGLSSSSVTLDVREAERFMAADGSDCGIANVNIAISGAESAARNTPAAVAGSRSDGREGLHAAVHQHGQLLLRTAVGAARALRLTAP